MSYVPSAALLLVAVGLALGRRRAPGRLTALLLGLLLLLYAELAVRGAVRFVLDPAVETSLVEVGALARPATGVLPHPFLQFTRNPLTGSYTPLGFIGPSRTYGKPAGVVRVACLGGSTTASGYPLLMERFLNASPHPGAARFEVLNFGMEGWTSAHSLVNFALNVLDFSVDYVVVHHGWNDNGLCAGRCPRGDYAHMVTALAGQTLHPLEKLAVGNSMILRWLMMDKLRDRVRYLRPPEEAPVQECPDSPCKGAQDVHLFQRNMESLIQLAAARGITVLLATMPHRAAVTGQVREVAAFIDRANQAARDLARVHAPHAILVDLDREMTVKMEGLFVDLAHMKMEGRQYKARRIGEAVLRHLAAAATQ